MKCDAWVKRLLLENDLSTEVAAFLACTRTHATIDRYVAVAMPEVEDMPRRYAACRAGLALLHQWARQRQKEFAKYVVMSSPELVIDDAWLADRERAPLPHVRVAFARADDDLPSFQGEDAALVKSTGDAVLDRMVFDGTAIVRRHESKSGGAWLVSLV
jgi:hypothetical protein